MLNLFVSFVEHSAISHLAAVIQVQEHRVAMRLCDSQLHYLRLPIVIGMIHLTWQINCYIWFILNSPEIIMTRRSCGGWCYLKSTVRIDQTEGARRRGAVALHRWFRKMYGKWLSFEKQAVGSRFKGISQPTPSDSTQTGEFVIMRLKFHIEFLMNK